MANEKNHKLKKEEVRKVSKSGDSVKKMFYKPQWVKRTDRKTEKCSQKLGIKTYGESSFKLEGRREEEGERTCKKLLYLI